MMRMDKQISVEFGQSMNHYISSLIDQKNFAEAIKYFETHRKELESIRGVVVGEVFHSVSKAYASITHYPTALKTARIAQNMVAEDGNSLLLAEIFITIGGVLRDMSEFKEADKAFRDAESIFRRNDCFEGQSRALNLLAGLFFRQNDYKNSLAVLMDAINIVQKLDDKRKLAFMMGNIGRIYTFIGNFKEAKKHLNINIELSRELNDITEEARAYLSIGYVYIQEADYDEAERTLEKAYPLIVKSGNRNDEVIYLTYLGELRYRSNQLENARDILEKALVMANQTAPETTLEGRVMRQLAELYLRLNDYRSAQRSCSQAWIIMEKADNKVEMGALLKIKAIIAEADKREQESLKLYYRSIDLLDEAGVRFEKAETLIAAGKSKLFTVRQRMNYLFRVEEFYNRLNLYRKREEVEKLINEIDYIHLSLNDNGIKKVENNIKNLDYITSCVKIIQFKNQLPLIGRTDLPIILTGETGVGKDHLARYFHFLMCPGAPFVAINCASLPETLLESELFGFKKGAFTGAEKNKQGLFAAANGGVLLLDEIGDMPLSLQTKLLGVLENRKVVPLGSTTPVELDIKLIAATNKNLETMVERGTFRRDLYFRISGVTFEIPPLRKRKEDIPMLLNFFLKRCNLNKGNESIPTELIRQFVEYDWPGNVRELSNKVKRLEVMAQMVVEGDLVELSRLIFNNEIPSSTSNSLFDRVEQFERKILLEALLTTRGNKSEAARMLGIHEATVRTKLKRYNISLEQYN